MQQTLLCEPNISEGRNLDHVEQVADAVRAAAGVKLLDYSSDPDHNRSVFTYLGEPEAVLAATQRLAVKAFELIDMTQHHGSHPRQGALDVAPFIPVRGVESAEAVAIARRFGRFVGALGVPVYYYEEAATRPERVSLPDIRKGEYEALAGKLTRPEWAPDEGPAIFNPKSGATVTGARFPLVAFNVNLHTTDLTIADRIAKAVRASSGGYRYVRALTLLLVDRGLVQVSMNLVNYTKTPVSRVLEEVTRFYLQVHDFSLEQVIEVALIE